MRRPYDGFLQRSPAASAPARAPQNVSPAPVTSMTSTGDRRHLYRSGGVDDQGAVGAELDDDGAETLAQQGFCAGNGSASRERCQLVAARREHVDAAARSASAGSSGRQSSCGSTTIVADGARRRPTWR